MKQHLAHIALVVANYDDAIEFYTKKLNFDLIEDTYIPDQGKRWVMIRPAGASETCILLAQASNDRQKSAVGNQSGGRVFLFLYTDDFERDFKNLVEQKVEIVREPASFPYGRVAVFADLYGNLWDLIEPTQTQTNLLNG